MKSELTKYGTGIAAIAMLAVAAPQGRAATPTVFDSYAVVPTPHMIASFDPTGTGEQLPVVWGIDTAWPSKENMIRCFRTISPDNVGVVRVSFNPYALVTQEGFVPEGRCTEELRNRMGIVSLLEKECTGNKKVDIFLNLDACHPNLQKDYYYIKQSVDDEGKLKFDEAGNPIYENDWETGTKNFDEWARLINAYVKTIGRDYGNEVVTIAPFNEPDLDINGLQQPHFKEINKAIRANYPDLQTIRLSGGNTLNSSCALDWYTYLKEDLDEGNTHFLAGTFAEYADFFSTLRNDGKFATGDELHNVMEAIVGANYGMQSGIWWGECARVRGQFCQASNFGERLSYQENRFTLAATALYKRDKHHSQAFIGVSERAGRPSTFGYVSRTKPVYVDGVGPTHDFSIAIEADPNGVYGSALQRTAEAVYDVTWGEDIMPEINGDYIIVSKAAEGMAVKSGGENAPLCLGQYSASDADLRWHVAKVRIDNGADYSYYTIDRIDNADQGWNLYNWPLGDNYEPTDRVNPMEIWQWFNKRNQTDGYWSDNCLWHLEYAGNGWFRIQSKYSDFCLRPKKGESGTYADSNGMVQAPFDASDDAQLFRLIPVGNAPVAFTTAAPEAPANVTALAGNATITVSWDAVADAAGYVLLRSDDGDDFNTIARNLTSTEIIDNTVLAGRSYEYKVVAVDKSLNRSVASDVVQASVGNKPSLWCALEFNETLEDTSGNGFHPISDGNGRLAESKGRSYYVPASYSALMLPTGAVPTGGRFTVSAWVRSSGNADNGNYLFDFGSDEKNHVGLTISTGGSMTMQASSRNGSAELKVDPIVGALAHHVAAVFDSNEWTIYVDGVKKGSLEQAGLSDCIPDGEMVLNYVGHTMRQYTYYPERNGYELAMPVIRAVGAFHIYNYPLSAEEVVKDMNGETLGVDSPLRDGVEIASREYFNLKGHAIAAPTQGETVVVRTVYSDGKVETAKIVAED